MLFNCWLDTNRHVEAVLGGKKTLEIPSLQINCWVKLIFKSTASCILHS